MDSNDIWGYDNDGVQWSIPKSYSPEEANDPNLIIGLCKCCQPQPYGHVFKKADYPIGKVKYKCVFCGTGSTLIFNPVNYKDS